MNEDASGLPLSQIVAALELTPLVEPPQASSRLVQSAIVCDLLSYVMAHGQAGQIWITIQSHVNVVAVASLVDLAAVIIASGFTPEEEVRERAEEENIPIYTSPQPAFLLAGQLYALGLR